MKRKIITVLNQKEVALILAALMYYQEDLNWFTGETKEINKIKEKLNKKLKKTIKFKKIKKEDNLPF